MSEIPKREWCPPSPEYSDDAFHFNWGDAVFVCSQYNTHIRTFGEGKGRYDFISILNDGQPYAFPLHHPDISEVKERLLLREYPRYHDEHLDAIALEVYEAFAARGWEFQQN